MTTEPFYREDRPLIIAHRGARDVAPENTLAAFRAALEAGADGIELDVTRCATGEIVVIHDDTVDRTTDGHGRVAEMPFPALRELDAGRWFGEAFAGERIPLLAEVLDAVGGILRLNIEIKGKDWRDSGIEAEIAEMIRRRNLAPLVIISSFNPWALRRMRRAAPEVRCGFLYAAPRLKCDLAPFLAPRFLGVEALHPHLALVDDTYVARAQRLGLRLNVWTVNAPEDIRRLAALGVDGIITDHPALAKDLLGA